MTVYPTCTADCDPLDCDGRCRTLCTRCGATASAGTRWGRLGLCRGCWADDEEKALAGHPVAAQVPEDWAEPPEDTKPDQPPFLERLRAALVDTAGLDGIPEPAPLIRNVLYRDSIAWLIGPPGNGKSFVALDMSGSSGTGEPWQGFAVDGGDVLYLIAEGVSGVRPRVRAWESAAGRPMTGVRFLPVAVQASTAGDWTALVELAVELGPVLVVVDTQARVTVGMEENAAKDMGVFVHRLEQLRTATSACVLVVHHQGRNGEHMRGSTALEGAATTIIRVAKTDDTVTVACAKQKDAPPFDEFTLRLIPTGSSAVLALTDRPQGTDVESRAVRDMLSRWWSLHESDLVSVSMLVKSGVCTEPTFHRAKKPLMKAGVIERDGTGRSVRYRLPKDPAS